MLIRDFEKLRKKTLRERIYEEVVRLIVSGELPSGGWVDEKRVIDRLRVSRTPFRDRNAAMPTNVNLVIEGLHVVAAADQCF